MLHFTVTLQFACINFQSPQHLKERQFSLMKFVLSCSGLVRNRQHALTGQLSEVTYVFLENICGLVKLVLLMRLYPSPCCALLVASVIHGIVRKWWINYTCLFICAFVRPLFLNVLGNFFGVMPTDEA